jgi:hypothetical protein
MYQSFDDASRNRGVPTAQLTDLIGAVDQHGGPPDALNLRHQVLHRVEHALVTVWFSAAGCIVALTQWGSLQHFAVDSTPCVQGTRR